MRHAFLFAVALSLSTACARDRPTAPSGPSPDIGLATAPASVTMTSVTCTGPAGEVAALGALCGGEGAASAYHRVGAPLSLVTRIGRSGADDVPYLVVVGFAPAATPDDAMPRDWDAAAVRHAAYLVTNGGGDVISSLEAWMDGEPLSGELVTTEASNGACSTSWSGAGTLRHGGVTIEVQWVSAIPC